MRINKKAAAVAVAAVTVVGTGVAYAYWTAGGSGHGDASVANPTPGVTVSVTAPSNMTPGGAQAVTGSVANSNSYSVGITNLVPSLAVDGSHASCLLSDFSVSAVSLDGVAASAAGLLASPVRIAATTGSAPIAATLNMADTALNQDGCKGATVTVTFTAS